MQDTLPEISDTATNSDSVSWASVMGCFDYLIENLGECKKMFKTYTSSEIVIEKIAAIDVIQSVKLVTEAAESVVQAGTFF